MLPISPAIFQGPPDGPVRDEIKTILVVEDSADTRDVLIQTLWGYGHRVFTAKNGEEAIRVARRARPDLIIMDLNMPVLDGLAATERIRREPVVGRVPILAITAYDTFGMREATLEAGCDEYLCKPLDFAEFEKVVADLLLADSVR